jgi:hypothetical protein
MLLEHFESLLVITHWRLFTASDKEKNRIFVVLLIVMVVFIQLKLSLFFSRD